MDSLHNKRRFDQQKEADVLGLFNENNDFKDETAAKTNKNGKKSKLPKIIFISIICVILALLLVLFVANQPSINVKGDEQMNVEVHSAFEDPGANASFFAFNCSRKIVVSGNVDTSKLGIYNIDYSITKANKTKTATRIVNVVDTTAPDLQLQGDEQTTASSWGIYKEAGYTAIDNYDGDISASVQVTDSEQDGKHILTYTAIDSSGNTAIKTRTVEICDKVAPDLALSGKESIWISVGSAYTELGASAIDDADGVITDKIQITSNVNTNVAGDYTVTYTVSDSAGNVATKTRNVKVAPNNTIPESEKHISGSVIYLTFDDGPSSNVTPRILDILKRYNVKATFFVIGYSDANKAIVQRAVNEGHSIGVHGMTHEWTAYSSVETYMNNIRSLHDKILADTGYDTKITRFLGGSSNTVSRKYSSGIMSRLASAVQQAGYQYYDWNVSSADAESNTVATSTIISYVKGGLKPGRNNIVLMHDTNAKTTTADALPTIIEYGLKNGYTFAGLTPDVAPVHHGINN